MKYQRILQFSAVATLALSLSGCQFAAQGQNAQGVRLHSQGQYSAALQQFQRAIASNPRNPDSYYNLAATTHRLGIERNDPRLLEQAESLYNQCLDLSPNHVDCHRALSVLLVETERPDRAFVLLRNWATSQPGLADARIELARLYQEFGEGETAQKFLEDAIRQDGNSSRAWLALGQIREKSGDLGSALQDYQRSYNLNNMQPAVAERIAMINRQLIGSGQNPNPGFPSNTPSMPVNTSPQYAGDSGTQVANPQVGNISRGRY